MADLTSYLATPALEFPTWGIPIAILAFGILILKGFALYKAARNKNDGWFWAILLLNTFGLLPGIYLFINRKKKQVTLFEKMSGKLKVRY
jgi:hypothetical protein